jgi:ribosomal protein L37AE/L43A
LKEEKEAQELYEKQKERRKVLLCPNCKQEVKPEIFECKTCDETFIEKGLEKTTK